MSGIETASTAPQEPTQWRGRTRSSVFFALSLALHALLLFAFGAWLDAAPPIELELPDMIELGISGDRGESGEPPPAAPPAAVQPETPPEKPVEKPIEKPKPELAASDFAIDASVPTEEATDTRKDAPDGGVQMAAAPASSDAGVDGRAASPLDGDGLAPFGQGGGLGFGTGGFGTGIGGPPGAVIGLHVDLDRIRDSSLILETSALLELIPEWLQLLDGSGLDALQDFSRIFVASPSLKRSALVVSGRVRGGQAQVTRAVNALASDRGRPATFATQGALRVAPWWNRGPTERVIGFVGNDQIVIARPTDVSRALAVAAALATRHSKDARMERTPAGPASLLAMYQGEAVALSIEGLAQYVKGDASRIPLGARLSLRHLDEFNAELRAYGYYKTSEAAQAAVPYFNELRTGWIDHPQAQYLGLRAALEAAHIDRDGRTVTLEVTLTLHQVRYLLAFVSRALKPRD